MRTVILLLDWDARLFWRDAESWDRIDETTLSISAELKRRLVEYYKHYSELYLDGGCEPVSDLEKRLLDDTGLEVWRQLRAELAGIYHVLFHGEEFGCPFDSPEEFVARRKAMHA